MSDTTYSFSLTFDEPNCELGETEDALFEADCDDALLLWKGSTLRLEFDRRAESLSRAISSAIEDVYSAGLNIKLRRVGPDDLVTLADIARRSGVSREATRLWAASARRDNFPSPRATIGRSDVWSWREVTSWLHENGKVKEDVVHHATTIAWFNQVMENAHSPPPPHYIMWAQSTLRHFRT